MATKKSRRGMNRLIKVLKRNRALKAAAKKTYTRPASAAPAPGTQVAENVQAEPQVVEVNETAENTDNAE